MWVLNHQAAGLLAEHFDKNPPLIPANGHLAIDGEDKEIDHIRAREEQGALHPNTSTSGLGTESESYNNISTTSFNTKFSGISMSKPGPRPLAAFPVLTEYSDENTSSAYSRAPEKPKGGRKVFTMEELELASSILHSSKRVYVYNSQWTMTLSVPQDWIHKFSGS